MAKSKMFFSEPFQSLLPLVSMIKNDDVLLFVICSKKEVSFEDAHPSHKAGPGSSLAPHSPFSDPITP